MVRTLVGALTGPTCLEPPPPPPAAPGLLLLLLLAVDVEETAFGRVVPSKAFSSYQFDCLVASLVVAMVVDLSAEKFVVPMMSLLAF